MKVRQFINQLVISLSVLLCVSSCNSDPTEELGYRISTDVTVSGFSLKADNKILANLNSVFFSIDLDRGLIFNADSLPKGTSITSLIPVIAYPEDVSSAKITMVGGIHRTGEVDYIKSPTDSIDFTGDVILTLVAQDGITSRDYRLKVNVHKMEPDSLWWDEMAVSQLPSRLATPICQKTVPFNEGKIISLIGESDNSYTIAETDNLNSGKWINKELKLSFVPQVRTFTAVGSKFFILDSDGVLYESLDAMEWQSTGKKWLSVVGAYEDSLLGLREQNGEILHTCFPVNSNFTETPISEDFPIKGFSNFQTFTGKWYQSPVGIMTGGELKNGNFTNRTWGFDGENWALISENSVPYISGATMVSYFSFQQTSNLWVSNEYSVMLLIGGRFEDGTANKKIYISYDNGVNWAPGSELMQLPEYIPAMVNADNVVMTTEITGNYEPEIWSEMPSKKLPGYYKVNYKIDGYDVTWDCPYIYLIGGENSAGELYNTIWKGVLNRLTFVPLM